MAAPNNKSMWLQLTAVDFPDNQQPCDRPSLYKSSIEHYKTCRHVHAGREANGSNPTALLSQEGAQMDYYYFYYAGARLLGTITFYQVKRYKLFAVGPESHSCYEGWAQAFKQHPDNPELRTADMEWLARAGGIITFLMSLEGLPDDGRRAGYVVREVGSITQLKSVFPKVFNKKVTWHAGDRLQDLFSYEFRKIKEALKSPGTIQQLYRSKKAPKEKQPMTDSPAAEQMYPPALCIDADPADGATASTADHVDQTQHQTHKSVEQSSGGSAACSSSLIGSDLTASEAVTPSAAAPAAAAGYNASADTFAAASSMQPLHLQGPHFAAVNSMQAPYADAAQAAAAAAAAGLAYSDSQQHTQAVTSQQAPTACTAVCSSAAADLEAAPPPPMMLQTAASGTGLVTLPAPAQLLQQQQQQQEQQEKGQQHQLPPVTPLDLRGNAADLCWTPLEPELASLVAASNQQEAPCEFTQFLLNMLDVSDVDIADVHQQQQQQQQLPDHEHQHQEQTQQQGQQPAPAPGADREQQQQQPQLGTQDQEERQQEQQPEQQKQQLAPAEQQAQQCAQAQQQAQQVPQQQQHEQQEDGEWEANWDGDFDAEAVGSEDWEPSTGGAAKRSGRKQGKKRGCSTPTQQPGANSKKVKQDIEGPAVYELAGGGLSELTIDLAHGAVGGMDEEPQQRTPSAADDINTLHQQRCYRERSGLTTLDDCSTLPNPAAESSDITQHLLQDLKQQGLVCGTLLEWLQQRASDQGATIEAARLSQHSGLLGEVLVVKRWSEELRPLLGLGDIRQIVILTPSDNEPSQHMIMQEFSEGLGIKTNPRQAPDSNSSSEWKGSSANWMVQRSMLSTQRALKKDPGPAGEQVVSSHAASKLDLTHNDLACLGAGTWLNDECINFYLALLQDRDRIMYDSRHLYREGEGAYRAYYFNTHFVGKLNIGLSDYDYGEVKRWTKQKGWAASADSSPGAVLKYDRLIIPIHQLSPYQHWSVLLVDLQKQRLVFFDSYKDNNPIRPMLMQRVKQWLAHEAQDKLGGAWQTSDWAEECPSDLPRQDNGFDCGVFALMACNRLGLKRDVFDFSQQYMTNLRAAIAHDLKGGRVAASAHPTSALLCAE